MKLYLLRHGPADWPGWDRPDEERPLTAEGRAEVQKIGAALRQAGIEPALILASPLPRARETAEIVAEALGVPLREEAVLAPGFESQACRKLLAGQGKGDVMLVGHEPDLSGVVVSLTGGEIRLPKAGVAGIELEESRKRGRLLWLLPAKLLIRLYR